jgi:hypothetical protein
MVYEYGQCAIKNNIALSEFDMNYAARQSFRTRAIQTFHGSTFLISSNYISPKEG